MGGKRPGLRKAITKVEEAKFGSTQSLKDVRKEVKEREQSLGIIQRQRALEDILKKLDKGMALNSEEMRTLRQTTVKVFEKVSAGKLSQENVAGNLSEQHMEDIGKSDQLSEQEKINIRTARQRYFERAARDDKMDTIISRLSPADVARLPGDVLTHNNTIKHFIGQNAILAELARRLTKPDRALVRTRVETLIPRAPATLTAEEQLTRDWLDSPAGRVL